MSKKESIKILIEGEDQASAKIQEAAAKTREALSEIKDAGGEVKTSLNFVSFLADQLGGSEVSAFVGEITSATDQTIKFAQVAKNGGAGALAFKAGLAGLVATAAFSVGKFIGEWIFQTEKWNSELEKGLQKSKDLSAEIRDLAQQRFTDSKVDIELIRDPEEKRAAYDQLLKEVNTNLVGVEGQARASKKAAEEWAEAWQITGERKGSAQLAQQQADDDRARLDLLKQQQKELQRIIGIEAERAAIREQNRKDDSDDRYIENLEKQLELEKAIGDEKIAVQARQSTFSDPARERAEQLLREMEAIKQLREQEKARAQELEAERTKQIESDQRYLEGLQKQLELERAVGDEKLAIQARQSAYSDDARSQAEEMLRELESIKQLRDAEKAREQERKAAATAMMQEASRIQSVYDREVDSLEQQIVLLRDGKEAARQMALEKQGIAREDAKRFVEMQRQLEEQQRVETTRPTSTNTAMESRVMALGNVEDSPAKETAKNTEEAKKILDAMLQELKEQARLRSESTEQQTIELVGVE
ncbi:hypothetical protein SH449x_000753 [Pirellulaceae bacterium SH449]